MAEREGVRAERLDEELARLIRECRQAPDTATEKEEAWNLIADCVVSNAEAIVGALAIVATSCAGLEDGNGNT